VRLVGYSKSHQQVSVSRSATVFNTNHAAELKALPAGYARQLPRGWALIRNCPSYKYLLPLNTVLSAQCSDDWKRNATVMATSSGAQLPLPTALSVS